MQWRRRQGAQHAHQDDRDNHATDPDAGNDAGNDASGWHDEPRHGYHDDGPAADDNDRPTADHNDRPRGPSACRCHHQANARDDVQAANRYGTACWCELRELCCCPCCGRCPLAPR